jgi:hypothetical protein
MEHIKIFNSVAEKDNFIDADSFKYDIVGLVKNVEGVVYNPPQEVINSYTVSGITYDASVTFDSTANTVSWDYTLDKTTRSGKHVNTSGTDSQNVEYPVNTDSTNKNISGEIISYSEVIEYNFTQGIGTDKYFSFTALEDGTFTFSGQSANTSIEYSVNNGSTWATLNSGVASPTVTTGNKILWRGTLTSYCDSSKDIFGVGNFTSTGKFNAQGNIMSLLYGSNFEGQTTVNDGGFMWLFMNNANIVNSNGIILPITTAPKYCCYEMFRNCSSLETAMELKATTLDTFAYQRMFQSSNIYEAPRLPATTLGEGCYKLMFYDCINITNVPNLPATALTDYCYDGMFGGCLSLTSVPTDLLPATTLAASCYDGMFYKCSNLTNVPNLPATTLEAFCYQSMFKYCSSLKTVPTNLLPATNVNKQYAYSDMFGYCTSLENAPNLPATSIGYRCYQGMFQSCTSLTTAPSILPAMTLQWGCYWSMFQGCSSLVIAPVLPATALTSTCYEEMFKNCTSLNYIKAMFTTTPSTTSGSGPTGNWVKGVSSSGTFVKNSSATWNVIGDNGVPEGWTIETASS